MVSVHNDADNTYDVLRTEGDEEFEHIPSDQLMALLPCELVAADTVPAAMDAGQTLPLPSVGPPCTKEGALWLFVRLFVWL